MITSYIVEVQKFGKSAPDGEIFRFSIYFGNRKLYLSEMQKSFKEQSKAESLCGNTKGKTIIAIAKTTEDGKHITEKDIEPKHIKILKAPSFFTHAEGARYHIIKLDQKDRFSYAARRAFCEANKKCKL